MSYNPDSVNDVLFGGYSTTVQTLPNVTTANYTANYQLNFDTAIHSASVSSNAIIPTHQRSFAFCDVSSNAPTNYNLWRWGFSENNQQNAFQARNQTGTADDVACGIIKDTARINVSVIFRMNGYANIDTLNQLGGFFI